MRLIIGMLGVVLRALGRVGCWLGWLGGGGVVVCVVWWGWWLVGVLWLCLWGGVCGGVCFCLGGGLVFFLGAILPNPRGPFGAPGGGVPYFIFFFWVGCWCLCLLLGWFCWLWWVCFWWWLWLGVLVLGWGVGGGVVGVLGGLGFGG
ncbi:hypothetical protein RA265_27475 [Pseudomonas syringae pv. tagetis]